MFLKMVANASYPLLLRSAGLLSYIECDFTIIDDVKLVRISGFLAVEEMALFIAQMKFGTVGLAPA